MQLVNSPALQLHRSPRFSERLTECLMPVKNKTRSDWTVEQLQVQPYQHILEIGYASGNTLQEVARKLKVGFLAGIDESADRYQQAYRRNKKLIQQQFLQLHIGSIGELPYPAHYFHTVYGNEYLFFLERTAVHFYATQQPAQNRRKIGNGISTTPCQNRKGSMAGRRCNTGSIPAGRFNQCAGGLSGYAPCNLHFGYRV